MEYLFLIYADPQRSASLSPEQRTANMQKHRSITDDATARGIFRSAAPLEPLANAVVVRNDGTRATATDGPFAETKECIGGYYLLECASTHEARHWAERISYAVGGAPVEIRGLAAVPPRAANV
jgi:hypothetical protein